LGDKDAEGMQLLLNLNGCTAPWRGASETCHGSWTEYSHTLK